MERQNYFKVRVSSYRPQLGARTASPSWGTLQSLFLLLICEVHWSLKIKREGLNLGPNPGFAIGWYMTLSRSLTYLSFNLLIYKYLPLRVDYHTYNRINVYFPHLHF